MSRHYIDFVALDLPIEHDGGAAIDDPLAEQLDHRLDIVSYHVECLGDLQGREVQPHEIQADDPGPQGLVAAGEDRPGEVVEPLPAAVAGVALAVSLGVIPAVPDDRLGRAMGTGDKVRPSHIPDGLKA